MQKENIRSEAPCILDEVYNYIGQYVIYPNEQAKVGHAVWLVGSYFLENYKDILVFENYPIIAFLSPDEDSGKTRALDITQALAYNPDDSGSSSCASLCREIDQQSPKMITILLDEVDEIFTAYKDASDYIRLLNNGYQKDKYIKRASMSQDGKNIKTMVYCPKALAGLTVTKLKKTTRSRMLTIRMRPIKNGEKVKRHIDTEEAKRIVNKIENWKPTVINELKAVDEDSLSSLNNRAGQIWHPLLAIALVAGGEKWFNRMTESMRYFTNKQKPEENQGRKVLKELFKCYLMPARYPKNIRGSEFEMELRNNGFDLKYGPSYYLGERGYGLPIKQIKRSSDKEHPNQNGWIWDECISFFADHITEEEREEINSQVDANAPPLPLPTSTIYHANF